MSDRLEELMLMKLKVSSETCRAMRLNPPAAGVSFSIVKTGCRILMEKDLSGVFKVFFYSFEKKYMTFRINVQFIKAQGVYVKLSSDRIYKCYILEAGI